MQYLIDMDIMRQEHADAFNFHFSDFSITPLMLACAIGNKNIVKILLQSPIRESVNEEDSQGFNCLYYAVYHGHLPVVKLLKSISIAYKVDAKGTSCLHIAIMRGHANIVDFILKKTPKFIEESASKSNAQKNDMQKKKEDQMNALKRKTNIAIQWE
mmetsp:Transcript_40410/g.52983  ORF Transcript_40410/g.52983 Transcript_40410/m.52983 type:complete len:157 (-) Transcript_40410:1312-1782(-)